MKLKKIFLMLCFCLAAQPGYCDSLFFEDEPIQDGISVFETSKTFADIYEKLDGVKWGGKSINVAIDSLENLN